MKRLILLLSFTLVSLTGFCDTLDFWQIYLNEKPLADFNEFSLGQTITIKKSDIKEGDVITVKYGNDHPCVDCTYGIAVLLEIKQRLPEAKSNVPFEPLSISLKDLLHIQKSENVDRFPFYFFHGNEVTESGHELFTLIINT